MSTPRRSKTLTFSLPTEMEAQVRRVMKEDDLSVSELVREALRTYMHVRELRGTVHSRESLAHDEHALSLPKTLSASRWSTSTSTAPFPRVGSRRCLRAVLLSRDWEDMQMSERQDGYTPAALYARVSSDRQDVDLSVAAQLRALRDYAEKNGYLVARELLAITESRAFIKSFVKEIKVKPGKATVFYTLPTPPDSPIGGGDAAEVALHGPVVRSSVHVGGEGETRTPTPFGT